MNNDTFRPRPFVGICAVQLEFYRLAEHQVVELAIGDGGMMEEYIRYAGL